MKRFKIYLFLLITILLTTIPFEQPAIAETGGCGDCWKDSVKGVSWNPWGNLHTLCNCDTRGGNPGDACVCNPL